MHIDDIYSESTDGPGTPAMQADAPAIQETDFVLAGSKEVVSFSVDGEQAILVFRRGSYWSRKFMTTARARIAWNDLIKKGYKKWEVKKTS